MSIFNVRMRTDMCLRALQMDRSQDCKAVDSRAACSEQARQAKRRD